MEENTFLDYNPSYNVPSYAQDLNRRTLAIQGDDTNAIDRWWHPQIAENAEFERENYFMDKGNAFNEYMFNKANEYNSAKAQMERAKEAGLNPMLMAAGIAGSGASATPMQSQGASVGMNQNSINPLDLIAGAANTIDTISGATDKLGKLIGFGKENKLNFKIAKETATKLAEEAGKTRWERLQIQKTFRAFCRTAEANAGAAEQNVKNLEKIFDKYDEEIKNLGKQRELTEEQIRTQEHVTKEEMYKEYEMQFKNQFREMFGVQLNDSDTSMLAQLMIGGHGREVIDALSNMLKSIGENINFNLNDNPIIPDEEEKAYDEIWDKLNEEQQQKIPKWLFRLVMYDTKHRYKNPKRK